MAEDNQDSGERTEEATPERREEFRERGQIAVSRDVTSVFVLASLVAFTTFYFPILIESLERYLTKSLESSGNTQLSSRNAHTFFITTWKELILTFMPFFVISIVAAIAITFSQTRMNWSWKRLSPDFSRLNPLKGLANMVNLNAAVNLIKGIGKMTSIFLISYLIFISEWPKFPSLMNFPTVATWAYWGSITQQLFWAVSGFLLLIGLGDYLYNFITLENKLKMTKQEVKEDLKKREADPHVKAKIRRAQREMAMAKTLTATKEATVLITNPTHFSIALKYELGMGAPKVLAKGKDFVALRMRELAKELEIPIVENKPLAQTLFKTVEVGTEIPEELYRAVSEIIRYVFRVKGTKMR